jgi:hypothetical protein
LNPRIIFFAVGLLLFSCTPPPNEAIRTFHSFENFLLYTGNIDVEFVKDSTEYVKYYGNFYDNQTTYLELVPNDQSIGYLNYPMLGVKPYANPPAEVTKVEIHYTNLRTIGYHYNPPVSLGANLHYNLYSREPIIADSIDLWLRDNQDSTIDVNTNYLKISGGLKQSKVSGHASKMVADFQVWGSGSSCNYNYGELITDSSFLNLYGVLGGNLYTRVDVYANNYLNLDVQSTIGLPADCPSCLFEIYYKGYPTIHNIDSLDSRIVLIDNN